MENIIITDNANKSSEQKLLQQADECALGASVEKLGLPIAHLNINSAESIQKVVHQLQVHQIELEMQNEELRRTQFELETTKLRYFDLYDLAPVGYCTLNEQGLILEANLMAAKIFDSSRGDLVDKPISRFIFKGDQDIYYLHHKRLIATGQPQSCEVRILKDKGDPTWVNLNATYEKDTDGVPCLRKVITDISARKQVEQTLREAEDRYHREQHRLDQILKNSNLELSRAIVIAEKASAVAEKANLAKSDFLSNMSHELRTPLGTILGFAQLIDSGTPAPTPIQKRNVGQILSAGWYLLDLINEILDLALIESGRLSMSMEPVALSYVMRECQTMVEPQAYKHGIKVFFTEIKAPLLVRADRTRLKQVLINLLSNAIKYNNRGGTVVVSCTQLAGRIRIFVKDSGKGLTSELIGQLFQPFNRLGQENSGEEGTGIGLVMTKHLIELMGGEIGLESVVGEGSNFWVDLEHLAQTTEINAELKLASDPVEVLALQHNKAAHTVLYVEDNPSNLMLVEGIIGRRADIQLITAQDGARGIELARMTQPNIILMDINLPDMSGTNALIILSKDPRTAHIPVIAFSANAIPADIKNGLNAGFFRYLTKPIKIDEFMFAIDTALTYASTSAFN